MSSGEYFLAKAERAASDNTLIAVQCIDEIHVIVDICPIYVGYVVPVGLVSGGFIATTLTQYVLL